jgi:hypothetical protein
MMKEIDFVGRGATHNEAHARARINTVLITCLAEGKRLALQSPISCSSDFPPPLSGSVSPKSASSPTISPVDVPLQSETAVVKIPDRSSGSKPSLPMPVTSSRPQNPVQGPVFSAQSSSSNDAPFILQFEKKLNFHVTYKNQQRILHGIVDYSL